MRILCILLKKIPSGKFAVIVLISLRKAKMFPLLVFILRLPAGQTGLQCMGLIVVDN